MHEVTLHHDGRDWVARHAHFEVKAPTLDELDRAVERAVVELGASPPGTKVQVFMAFDNSTIPQWIRQYAQHYFNRIVEFEAR